jgi:hypothetical protein
MSKNNERFQRWFASLTPREKAGVYGTHLLADIPWEQLSPEQRAKCEAMVELQLLKYEAEDQGKVWRAQ